MNEESTMLGTMEEVAKRRLEKYQEKIHAKPKNRNQLLFKDGQAIFVKNGQGFLCNKVEGYVRLPGMDGLESVGQLNMAICFLTKQRMIIQLKDQVFFRGFRQCNTADCILLLHVSGDCYDVLVADLAEDIPTLVGVDDVDDGIDIVNPVSYQIMEYLMKKSAKCFNVRNEVIDLEEGVEDDEWE